MALFRLQIWQYQVTSFSHCHLLAPSPPFTRTLVITGADKNSVDTDTYSEEIIEEALARMKSDKKADKDFGDNSDGDWGSMDIKSSDSNDEDEEW